LRYRETIPVATCAKLKNRFTADRFDAARIAALAVDAGMKCITMSKIEIPGSFQHA
jgi:hypothetical protein